MSDSEVDIPSEAALARALRDVVIAIHKSGNTDDLTVKRVRTRAENQLGLPDGFFKHESWKQKSQELIHEAVGKYCVDDLALSSPPEATTPKKAPPKKASKPKPEPKKKAKYTEESARGTKRKAAAPAKKPQKKRRRTALSDDEEDALSDDAPEDQLSEAESEPPKKAVRRQKKVAMDSDHNEAEDSPPKARDTTRLKNEGDSEGEMAGIKHTGPEQLPASGVKDDASESEMSSLIDESPVKKRQKKASVEKGRKGKSAATKTAKSKAPPKSKVEDDPDQAEIKRLQSWLVKCGIRKVWGKELANCDTSKEKIRHLKGMLKDAGMDGKYSNEKAAQIKEKREFAKDLEEIQAGALAWGESEKTDTRRPRRRATKPIPKPAVPSDDEDEDDGGDTGAGKDATDDDMDDNDDGDVEGESEDAESDSD